MPTIESRIVEVCVFRKVGEKPLYLLLQRAKEEKIYPGIWQIVTGMVEKGERAMDAALRELREETSLGPLHFWTLPLINSFLDPYTDTIHHCSFFAVEVSHEANPKLSAEHQQFGWYDLEKATGLLPWTAQRQALEFVEDRFARDSEEARLLLIKTLSHRKDVP